MMDYNTYIVSNAWRVRRYRLAEAKGWKCDKCGFTPFSKSQIDVHHLNYECLGKETPEDVQLLCRNCHESKHPDNRFMNREIKRVFRKMGDTETLEKLQQQFKEYHSKLKGEAV